MLLRFFQLLAVLAPVGAFALALQPVEARLYGGHATQGILLLLAALAALTLVETLLFRYWILPGWSERMAQRLYAGSYLPEDDELAVLIDRIETEKDVALMPCLEQLVRRQKWRLRGWLELARLQQELQHDAPAALHTLEEAVARVRGAEDVAMLMYRASQLCEKSLRDPSAAEQWLLRLAAQYPASVYGRKALERLRK